LTQQPGDQYGGLPIPLQVPTVGSEVADPSVSIVAAYAAAVLNAHAQAAYGSVVPPVSGLVTRPTPFANPVVRKFFTRDPGEEEFQESDLPAIYCWRQEGDRPYWMAEDYRVAEDHLILQYWFQPAPQASRTLVQSFVNGVVKVLDRAIEQMRDPVFVAPGDPDPTAATTPPNPSAFVTPTSTSTAAVVITGAGLDGAVGGAVFAPPQLPTVTITGVAGQGIVEFVGLGTDGKLRISRVAMSGSGTFAGDFQLQQVQQIIVPPQLAGGTVSFGLYGFAGLGTQILILGDVRVANVEARQIPISALMRLEIAKWRQFRRKLDMAGGSPQRGYPHTVELTLNTQERWFRYFPGPSPVVDVQIPAATPPAPGTADNADLRDEALFT